MPRGDKTGPDGKGSKTGRGLGLCSGSTEPGFRSDGQGRGTGRGQGGGRGKGQRFGPGCDFGIQTVEFSKKDQIKILEAEKKAIENKLKELE